MRPNHTTPLTDVSIKKCENNVPAIIRPGLALVDGLFWIQPAKKRLICKQLDKSSYLDNETEISRRLLLPHK